MVNISRLKDLITEKHSTLESLANDIGISKATLYQRLKQGGRGFTVYEVQKIVEMLGLTSREATSVFFSNS